MLVTGLLATVMASMLTIVNIDLNMVVRYGKSDRSNNWLAAFTLVKFAHSHLAFIFIQWARVFYLKNTWPQVTILTTVCINMDPSPSIFRLSLLFHFYYYTTMPCQQSVIRFPKRPLYCSLVHSQLLLLFYFCFVYAWQVKFTTQRWDEMESL